MTIKYDHSDEYYSTDLKNEAIDYLNKLSLFLDKTIICKSYWKWVIISLHGSFSHFKSLLRMHGGLRRARRYKVICEILKK